MTLYIIFIVLTALVLAVLLAPLRRNIPFVIAISAVFFIGAFTLYHLIGAPEIIPLLAERDAKIEELKTEMTTLSGMVKENPKNLMAWARLGVDFMETGQYSASANAFKQAVILSHGDPNLILAYAEARIAEADGKITDDAKKGLEMVLLQRPNDSQARYWLIVRKLQDGDTQNAMTEMKALYHSLPNDSPLKATIDRQIGRN